jgi:hypothetical protein
MLYGAAIGAVHAAELPGSGAVPAVLHRLWPLRAVLLLALACDAGSSSDPESSGGGIDRNGDNVADDLGTVVDADGDGFADWIDINGDGKLDGPGVDTDGDGKVDALALDTDCDGVFDSLDTNGDGLPDWQTGLEQPRRNVPGCEPFVLDGSDGGTGGSGSAAGGSGSSGKGGSPSMGGTGSGGTGPISSELGTGVYQGTGTSSDRYAESDIFRNGVGYKFIANGWGDNWQSHEISWRGTSFTVKSLNGSQGANYAPAGYPTVFCGLYSQKQSMGDCGLPQSVTSLKSIRTGWRWKANGNGGQYNAAYDIWLGNGGSLSSYLMVWLRDPPGQQPAGSAATAGANVPGLPGAWNIWTGNVMGRPIVNYVRAEGQDVSEVEFDVMELYRDAQQRNYSLPGQQILAVAVGFEVWNGPISNLVSEDFYVDVQ